jgi:hypothetical protein
MSMGTMLVIALVLAAAILVSDVAQLWWFGRRSNPDHGPRSRDDWEQTSVADLRPGDVVLSSHLSPNPETVIEAQAVDADRVALAFRSGRRRTIEGTTSVRRHRPDEAG